MKRKGPGIWVGLARIFTNLIILAALDLHSQSFIAYEVPPGTVGNQAIPGLGVGNDFQVVSPITISQLGVFDSGTNGIHSGTVLSVQLYERSGRRSGTLLETMTFDAANPGTRSGGSLFKPLAMPVTLLPGNYTIAAYGFDTNRLGVTISKPADGRSLATPPHGKGIRVLLVLN